MVRDVIDEKMVWPWPSVNDENYELFLFTLKESLDLTVEKMKKLQEKIKKREDAI